MSAYASSWARSPITRASSSSSSEKGSSANTEGSVSSAARDTVRTCSATSLTPGRGASGVSSGASVSSSPAVAPKASFCSSIPVVSSVLRSMLCLHPIRRCGPAGLTRGRASHRGLPVPAPGRQLVVQVAHVHGTERADRQRALQRVELDALVVELLRVHGATGRQREQLRLQGDVSAVPALLERGHEPRPHPVAETGAVHKLLARDRPLRGDSLLTVHRSGRYAAHFEGSAHARRIAVTLELGVSDLLQH